MNKLEELLAGLEYSVIRGDINGREISDVVMAVFSYAYPERILTVTASRGRPWKREPQSLLLKRRSAFPGILT